MGMERIAYSLGEALGIPMPRVCLEEFQGHPGSLQWRIDNARSWMQAPGCPMLMNEISNEDQLPLCFMFDLWIANIDRVDRNLLAQADPPSKLPKFATKCRMWLVDHGCTGLWFPAKFDAGLAGQPVEQVIVGDGMMRDDVQRAVLGAMPQRFRQACRGLDVDRRDSVLDLIRSISDNDIEAAVTEVPSDYISEKAKELTIELLKARRDRVDDLYAALVP
jgi:hypothetical protein